MCIQVMGATEAMRFHIDKAAMLSLIHLQPAITSIRLANGTTGAGEQTGMKADG